MPFPLRAVALVAACLLAPLVTACDAGPDPKLGSLSSATDSAATAREVRASLTGEAPPGRQSYSYRGLYAGMPRSRLELLAPDTVAVSPPDSARCAPSARFPTELQCAYDARLSPDSALARLEVTYTALPPHGERAAREITITRSLPIDVDGVRLAGELADAFDGQTALLDARDASYGHHQAHVRMGTTSAAHPNFAEVTVSPLAGREVLVVKLSRGAAPPKPPATPAKR